MLTAYWPGWSCRTLKNPWPSAVTVFSALVLLLRMVTVALAAAAPVESRTVPVMAPVVVVCA
jgi:hypothetical protein